MTVPPLLYTPPPSVPAIPPLIVKPERAAEPPLTMKTPLLPPPLTVRLFPPGPVIVVVALLVRISGPLVRVIVWGVMPKTAGSKVMVWGPVRVSA